MADILVSVKTKKPKLTKITEGRNQATRHLAILTPSRIVPTK